MAKANEDPLVEAKDLLRSVRAGALATLSLPEGAPFASLVNVATAPDGSPILLLSRLAAHTRHLEADPRMSLLLARGGSGDPLAHPRLTLTGAARRVVEPSMREWVRTRFLAKHPKSALYADFPDFSFWLVEIARAHLNGGFARAASFDGVSIQTKLDGAEALIAAEVPALAHLNEEHGAALALYATVLAGKPPGTWRASGLDPEGLDLACEDETARIGFPERVEEPGALRLMLKSLAEDARLESVDPGALG
jgi:putative heme iron utilization protein